MIYSSSSFIASSMPLLHNGVKSLIFKCTEILMALFIYKLLSLFAARSNKFTAYLMFSEDYIQRWLFLSSRGFSRAALIVLLFTLLNVTASLYGTLLWALDSPGYILRLSNATAADYLNQLNHEAPYIVQVQFSPDKLAEAPKKLPQMIGADLFKPGLNYTLVGQAETGSTKLTRPSRGGMTGARIWLDDEGFSVSADSLAMFPTDQISNGQKFPECVSFDERSSSWNCTFNNTFSLGYVQDVVGKPEVHWSDDSDAVYDSAYISPNRVNNIWNSFGSGAGSASMMQVFSVTKGTKRHTFAQSVLRLTMLTTPNSPFEENNVQDFVERTWSANVTERKSPFVKEITASMMHAQANHLSYLGGAGGLTNENKTVVQSSWGFLTTNKKDSDEAVYSLISVTAVSITLIRSDTLDQAPIPLEECDRGSWHNQAFGGKVTQTNCAQSNPNSKPIEFYGQVDTAAVVIIYGLGDGRSNLSSKSLDESVMSSFWANSGSMLDLLVARAYIVSTDPSLVVIEVAKLKVAMSGLQLTLSIVALLLAALAWLASSRLSGPHWSSTLLASLVYTTLEENRMGPSKVSKLGYMHNPPRVELVTNDGRTFITVSGKSVMAQEEFITYTSPSSQRLLNGDWVKLDS